jgi:UDP-N-acetylmuramyl tripeptide synthase
MTDAKFVIRRALGPNATLVLNADDSNCVDRSHELEQPVTWITREPQKPLLLEHLSGGGSAWWQDGDWLMRSGPQGNVAVVRVDDIPVTMDGAAGHNISNALGAAALCQAMGVSDEAIRMGLGRFRGDADDNPGRGNWFEKGGVRILLDFAHNEHGMSAIAGTVQAIPATRRLVMMGQAGDRSDQDIADLVAAAASMLPEQLLVSDLPGYDRGRKPGEVPILIRNMAIDAGVADEAIRIFDSPTAAACTALAEAHHGDVLVLLVMTEREQVLEMIREFVNA